MRENHPGFPSYSRCELAGEPARQEGDAEAAWARVVVTAEHSAGGEQVRVGDAAVLIERAEPLIRHQPAPHLGGGVQVLQVPQARAIRAQRPPVVEDSQSEKRLDRGAASADSPPPVAPRPA